MKPFTAILLVAGVGSRLRPLTDRLPKCLAPLGAETVLARMVRLLAAAGAAELVVSTGHLDALVREALDGSPVPARFAHNPDHASTQNVVSLHRALALVRGGDVVKLDGDVAFEPAVLARLLAGGADAQAAVDDAEAPDAEAMKVRVESGLVRRFGKGIDPRDAAGESIGIERLSARAVPLVADAVAAAVRAGRTDVYYEDVYNDALDAGLAMEPVSVAALRWTEIDDARDLARARELFARG